MARCSGFKPDGSRCTVLVSTEGSRCYWHDPDKAEARRRNAAKGGKGRGSREIRVLKDELRTLIADVRDGQVEQGRAAVLGQLYNCLLRAAEVERRWRETDDLEDRLSEIEAALEAHHERRAG